MSRFARTAYRKKSVASGPRKLPEMTRGELEKLLDEEVSLHVRGTPAVKNGGYVHCYTCGTLHHYKKLDAGHYVGRAHRGTRWDLRNIRPQCTKCNSYEEGRHWQFRRHLVVELGAEEVEDVERLAEFYGETKYPTTWLVEQIEAWRAKNRALRKELKCL
jgi:hypothetical protein